jgi:ER membrane protein complex subunit 7
MRAEFEERQKSSSTNALMPGAQQANPLGNFDAAAWLAGSGKKSEGGGDRAVEKGVKR